MKKVFFSLLITLGVVWSGCFETTEGILINADGSGTYTVDMDMGGLLTLMNMAKAADTAAKGPENIKNLDSTILFKSITDTSTSLSKAEKALLRNAKVHVKMSDKEEVFKVKMTYPFAKVADIAQLMALTGSNKGGNAIKKILSGTSEVPEENNGNINAGMPNYSDLYQMTYSDGLLDRKIKEEKLAELGNQFKGGEGAEMEDMMESIKLNSVITLPRPAKKVEGEKATLSADKKKITINCSMKDVLANPKVVNYHIEY